ncbi:MAG TPA: four helix bundle protein [Pirellulales bacterium]|nr:four helix bundle protein [Pirellulales bacterium]
MDKPHKNLKVWRRSMDFVTIVYQATTSLPPEEKYGLTSQMRRSAVSIVSNIAEGAARQGSAEYIRFLNMSIGSVSEIDTQLEVCRRLGFIAEELYKVLDQSLAEIDRMLIGLRNSIRRRRRPDDDSTESNP